MLSTNEIVALEESNITIQVFLVMSSVERDRDVELNVTSDIWVSRLTITPEETFATVTIPIPVDNVIRENRMFMITFTPVNSLDVLVNSTVKVVILESEILWFKEVVHQINFSVEPSFSQGDLFESLP